MTATHGRKPRAVGRFVRSAPRRSPGYRRVRLASWALVGVAAALAAVFAVHIGKFEAVAPSLPDSPSSEPASNLVVVTNSRLTGVDRQQQPYSVTAASAVQDSSEPNLVHLTSIAGELRRPTGDVLSLAARTALYDSKAEMLRLEGEVTIITSGRFVAEMADAEVTLSDTRLRSDSPVTVTFDRGEIIAGGLEITDDGKRVVFFNRAKVTFGPQTKGDMLQ